MTTRVWFLSLAATVAALISVFLPEKAFSFFLESLIHLCIVGNTIIAIEGWETMLKRISALLPHAEAISGFLIINRLLASVSILVDAMMIYIGINWGIIPMFLVGTIVFFFICMIVIWLYGIAVEKGYDLLLIERVKEIRNFDHQDRLTRWVTSDNKLLFWVGSLWLEPDIVTLIMRKRGYVNAEETLKITLPSVVWCIGFWSVVFYLGILGYEFFDQFVGIFMTVIYLVVLGREYYKSLKQ